MADGTVAVNSGSGILVDAFIRGTGITQYAKAAQATAVATRANWTTSLTANTTFLGVSDARTCVLLVNNSTARIYLRFDTTAPTATVHDWRLDPMDRWEVPPEWAALAISVVADAAGVGNVLALPGTRS
jgi:hypothetical protein